MYTARASIMSQTPNNMETNKLETGKASVKTKATRIPMCSRCQNHGIKVEVKYHKADCEYRDCTCLPCLKTTYKQIWMKEQTAQRRARQRDEKVKEIRRNKLKTIEQPQPSTNTSNSSNRSSIPWLNLTENQSQLLCYPTLPTAGYFEPNSHKEQIAKFLECSLRLLQFFGYSWESLSLLYTIVQDSKADIRFIVERILRDVTSRRLFDSIFDLVHHFSKFLIEI